MYINVLMKCEVHTKMLSWIQFVSKIGFVAVMFLFQVFKIQVQCKCHFFVAGVIVIEKTLCQSIENGNGFHNHTFYE